MSLNEDRPRRQSVPVSVLPGKEEVHQDPVRVRSPVSAGAVLVGRASLWSTAPCGTEWPGMRATHLRVPRAARSGARRGDYGAGELPPLASRRSTVPLECGAACLIARAPGRHQAGLVCAALAAQTSRGRFLPRNEARRCQHIGYPFCWRHEPIPLELPPRRLGENWLEVLGEVWGE